MLRLLQITHQTSQAIEDFLNKNIIGTPGTSAVYQQLSTSEKLRQLPKPHFAELRKRDKLLSICCFCEREMTIDGQSVQTFYVRYFSFLDTLRASRSKADRQKPEGTIKKDIKELLTGLPLAGSEPNTFYAYVDPKNERSMQLCRELGFEVIRGFSTYTLGHLFPKRKLDFEQFSEADQTQMRSLLHSTYSTYNFYTEDNLFYRNQYYYVRDSKGKILAGIQANPEKWIIHSLPGRLGNFLLNVLGRLPITRRLIQRNYQFLALDYIYCASGQEAILSDLIESLMTHHQCYSAMILADDRSPLSSLLPRLRLGIANKIKKPVSIQVIAKSNHLSDPQLNHLKNHPAFLSSFDTT